MTSSFIPYGRQLVDEDDIAAVIDVLRSDWLTTGPCVAQFEEAIAAFTGAPFAVAVSSGTAALHAAMHAIGIGPGDEVIVPAITFAATANAVMFQGATPVFADIEEDTLLVDPTDVERRITPRTRAVIAVDYAGQPCNYDVLRQLTEYNNLTLVADSCHSLGAEYKGRKVGTLADLTVFSFHPVKHITTGEGGMIVVDDAGLAEKMRSFRNHGISTDHRQRELRGTWYYEMQQLGYNYRITDIQCALGLSQLNKLPAWLCKRKELAATYDEYLRDSSFTPLATRPYVQNAYHLYVGRLPLAVDRNLVFQSMRHHGIGVNVHYLPVYLHPYYRQKLGAKDGLCPQAEKAYERILSLPLNQTMDETAVERIVRLLIGAMEQ